MTMLPQLPASILIVDDDFATLTSLISILELQGHECHGARDAASAKRAAGERPLDLILCDIDLQEDDGLQLCRELKRIEHLQHVPVLFLSGAGHRDIVDRAHAAGGMYYLHKPFDPDVLIELVEKALWMPHVVETHARHTMHAGHRDSGTPSPSGMLRRRTAAWRR